MKSNIYDSIIIPRFHRRLTGKLLSIDYIINFFDLSAFSKRLITEKEDFFNTTNIHNPDLDFTLELNSSNILTFSFGNLYHFVDFRWFNFPGNVMFENLHLNDSVQFIDISS